jgi:type II secretory pathway pseudopilin PulG
MSQCCLQCTNRDSNPAQQSGYTLVALLAVMTLLSLFALAAAPSMRQQLQRQREKEAIFRGEQVADAIRAFYIYRASTLRAVGDQALPTSIDQLLEGIPIQGGSKKRQILRASAARDPLSAAGEWRLIRPRSQELIDFQQSIIAYAGNLVPPSTDPQMAQLQQLAVPQLASVLNIGTKEATPADDDSSDSYSGPFVGVASRSRNSSVLYYYDIDRHDQWIFTPLFR